jgi:hypothetical protein
MLKTENQIIQLVSLHNWQMKKIKFCKVLNDEASS